MEAKVREVLKSVEIALKLHAGGIELVSCTPETGEVVVRLLGTCAGCGLSEITLKEGVEVALVRAIPEIRLVRAVQ
jgi:Fe-S cluster biogenesis protein NfuA